jgi:hypothetical protein
VDTVWQDRNQQDAWVEMWQAAAEHFRGNPNIVAYKIMVEPNASAQHFEIYDPEEFFNLYGGTTYDWNFWFPEIIMGIREVDAETPILVGADDFSSVDWLPFVTIVDDEKTAHYVDQYEPFIYTHQEAQAGFSYPGQFDTDFSGTSETFDLQWLQRHMSTVSAFEADTGRQATVEEFGVHRWAAGAADYLNELISIFEDSNWNYAIWLWETEWEEYTDVVNDFNWRFGVDPTNMVDVPNELQDVLTTYWALNRLRPSNVTWIEE